MPAPTDIADQVEKLDPVERENVFVRLAKLYFESRVLCPRPTAAYPGIVRTPDVCGGAARLIRTRIPVWTLERMRQLGVSEADILRSYPSLQAIDLVQAWAYADDHADEIEALIRENEE